MQEQEKEYQCVHFFNDGINYVIHEIKKTASVGRIFISTDEIFIPSFIEYESQNYDVINFLGSAFNDSKQIKYIHFASDSRIKRIYYGALNNSSIESITIPKSVIELDGGWCINARQLTKITVHPDNPRYLSIDDKMIIGKSTLDQENYDVCVSCIQRTGIIEIPSYLDIIGPYSFANLSIESITIPSKITKIDNYAFSQCIKLQKVEFQPDSNLKIIGKKSFECTAIESIRIPSSVEFIDESAFYLCKKLSKIEFHNDSKLKTIKPAFYCTCIESIEIPKSVVDLEYGLFNDASKLIKVKVHPENPRYSSIDDKMIIGKSDLDKENYDVLVFCANDIETVTIPTYLDIIGSYSFNKSQITCITIPSNITRICTEAFNSCKNLKFVEFQSNSKLQIIENSAFWDTAIERIVIPSNVTSIGRSAFSNCRNLEVVEFQTNSKLEIIDGGAFSNTAIEKITFPTNLKSIGEHSFSGCSKLQIVDFPNDTKLTNIENGVFFDTSIKEIIIPKSVEKINGKFLNFMLKKVQVHPDNKYYKSFNDLMIIGKSSIEKENFDVLVFCLQNIRNVTIPEFIEIIGKNSFSGSLIEKITIPSNVRKISEFAFYECMQLRAVDIPFDSQIRLIDKDAFTDCPFESLLIPSLTTHFHSEAFFICYIKIIELGNNINEDDNIDPSCVDFNENTIVMTPVGYSKYIDIFNTYFI